MVNDFRVWAAGASTQIYTQAQYLALPQLSPGVAPGIADPLAYNKTLRQATIMSTMLANFITQELPGTDVLDDGTTATILANFIKALQVTARIKLTANLDLFVATNGNDSNDGLTAGTPMLTLQAAYNKVMRSYDVGGNSVTIHVANGTYNAGVTCCGSPPGSFGGVPNFPSALTPPIQFVGNVASPTSVVINAINSNCFAAIDGAHISVFGFRLLASGISQDYNQQGVGLYAFASGGILFGAVDFGACSQRHIASTVSSIIESAGNSYSVSGGAPNGHIAAYNSSVAFIAGSSVTFSGSPVFSGGFAIVAAGGSIGAWNMIFGGTFANVTGGRYQAVTNGVIQVQGAGANYFPGSSVGIIGTGGQYG
jgi:hypothetical protein